MPIRHGYLPGRGAAAAAIGRPPRVRVPPLTRGEGADLPRAGPRARMTLLDRTPATADGRPPRTPLLRIEGVKKHFPITRGVVFQKKIGQVHAVDGVDLDVYPGETLGLVGETGCGKSTLARLITKLYDVTEGRLFFGGGYYTNFGRRQMRPLRRQIQMVFQDPYASLNPRKTVGSIIADPFRIHGSVPKK